MFRGSLHACRPGCWLRGWVVLKRSENEFLLFKPTSIAAELVTPRETGKYATEVLAMPVLNKPKHKHQWSHSKEDNVQQPPWPVWFWPIRLRRWRWQISGQKEEEILSKKQDDGSQVRHILSQIKSPVIKSLFIWRFTVCLSIRATFTLTFISWFPQTHSSRMAEEPPFLTTSKSPTSPSHPPRPGMGTKSRFC